MARAAAAGTATSIPRRTGNRQVVQAARPGRSEATALTRARSSVGAEGRDVRSSWISSGDGVMVTHPLFELGQGAAQPRRDGRDGNPEQACGLLAVEIENDAQCEHLALTGRERLQALGELRREALAEGREVAGA